MVSATHHAISATPFQVRRSTISMCVYGHQSKIKVKRIFLVTISSLKDLSVIVGLYLWDFILVLLNIITPDHSPGTVVREGNYGFQGKWPEYIPPSKSDSRSPCPGLNAMANHGIISHSGRGIKFAELHDAIRKTYNVSAPFSVFLPRQAAEMLNRDPATGTFDLSDVSVHNMIEHDASFVRDDIYRDTQQSAVYTPIVEDLLASATGHGGIITPADFSRFLGKRRIESKSNNPQFSMTLGQKLIGSTNAAFVLTVFGGLVADLRAFLIDERLPDGWEPRVRHRMGLTMTEINKTIAQVELGVEAEVDGSFNVAQYQQADKKTT